MSFLSNAWNAQKQSLADFGSYIDYAGETPQAQSVIKAIPEMGASEWLQSLAPKPAQASTTDTQPTNFIRQQPAPTNTPTSNTAYAQSPVPGATLQIPQTPQVQSSTPDYSSEINDIFQPAYASLQTQADLLPEQKSLAEGELRENARVLQDELGLEVKGINQDVAGQRQGEKERSVNAMDQARRMFNQLTQQSRSRYGAGSSTGPAVNEILSREYMANSGEIRKSYSSNMGRLANYSNRVQEFSLNKTQEIQRQVTLGLKQISSEFYDRMAKIAIARNTLESAKAEQKLAVMRDAISRTQAVKDSRDKALFDMQIWKAQEQSKINTNVSQLNDNYSNLLTQQESPEVTYSKPEDSSGQRTYNNLYQNPFLDNQDDELAQETYSSQYFT